MGRDTWDNSDRESLVADEMRGPLTGLSAEYMRLTRDNRTSEFSLGVFLGVF